MTASDSPAPGAFSPAAAATIADGRAVLGIELGSTRIKACLIGATPTEVLATGAHDWENQLVDGVWTYSLDAVWTGLQDAVAALAIDVRRRYGAEVELTRLRAIGVSAMMHGYLPFDADGELLVPFRTWRNTSTGAAARELSAELGVNIPLRWSIAHLHQAVLDGEAHVPRVAHLTTLAGHVHERLTGRRVLGVGDASGMFPIDAATGDYDAAMLARCDELAARAADATGVGLTATVRELLPDPLAAGAYAGALTAAGAALLDPSGRLQPGALLCPPEGDAGTGMVATDAVAPRTGNVSAGTSVFAMVVLEHPLARPLEQIDVVTTPAGDPVAMVHCNNGASELGAWAAVFRRFAEAFGGGAAGTGHGAGAGAAAPVTADAVFATLLGEAARSDVAAGGLLAYNHLAGEPIAGLEAGRPLVVRAPDSDLTLGNFVRAQLYGVFGTLALGMRVLADEGVAIERMQAHGGIFRTAGVAQRVLAAALDAPVAVAETAAEGGAWGVALLALYAAESGGDADSLSDGGRGPADAAVEPGAASSRPALADWLREHVFAAVAPEVAHPDTAEVAGYAAWLERYRAGLAIERAAVAAI
ncbi:FGGY-family carbohydrate kinase [Schumannella soli]|uniref:ATPase n=1 Tax=Schumannella soli TaxID=2590779 RepID=A0A506Y9A0_9MICO|nr:FGGY-family carbohydrate kinase [Schumannella soli]TPW77727.1 ATPase [Schumannella soli]